MSQPTPNEQSPYCQGCLSTDTRHIGQKDGYEIYRCHACNTSFVFPRPSPDSLNQVYDGFKNTDNYLRKKKSKIKRIKRRIRRMIKHHKQGKSLLDVGCSVGFTAPAAAPFGLQIMGIDLDSQAIEIAKNQYSQFGKFDVITIENHAQSGEMVDMVYAVEIIEHVPNPESFIEAIGKILKPGGILYITAPDGGHFRIPKDFISWDMVCPPDHLTWFTRKGLETLLARYGLIIEYYQLSFKPGIKAIARKKEA